ncbi:MAG: BatA domain-containing protein [Aureliella sp.]
MSFLHLSLLAGAAAIAVPIMLHLFGQQKPKLVDFPAMRFVVQTAREQSSSWQLRHFLLLLLRVLLLAALAFALARPRVHSAMLGSTIGAALLGIVAAIATLIAAVAFFTRRPAKVWLTTTIIALALWAGLGVWLKTSFTNGPTVPGGDQAAPIAAAIIVDNGPTLEYRSAGQTRLEKSQEFVKWLLGELPPDSRVGLLSGAPVGALSLDPAAAAGGVDLIKAKGATVDLASRLRTALELVTASELERKEIYIVTDSMEAAWKSAGPELQKQLDAVRGEVLLQIVDVGGSGDANWSLGDVSTDVATAPVGAALSMQVSVTRPVDSDDTTATVELYAQKVDPTLPILRNGKLVTNQEMVVDRQVVDFADGNIASVSLVAPNLKAGTNNFRISLGKPDPLEIDNNRYVSVPTFASQPTLVVASDSSLARYLSALFDPYAPEEQPLIDQVQPVQLADTQLEKYSVVCLYDPPRLPAAVVEKLYRHTAGGGGLFVILGPQASTGPQNASLDRLLPGKLASITQHGEGAMFDVSLKSHPVFAQLNEWLKDSSGSLWTGFPVYKSCSFTDLEPSARMLIRVSDSNTPALVNHDIGRGQVLTLTTPLPEPENRNRDLWNLLWVGESPYQSFALLIGAYNYLSGAEHLGATFRAGQSATLPNDVRRWPSKYSLYAESLSTPVRLSAPEGLINLPVLESAGVYYLRGQRDGPVVRAVSANVPSEATVLSRVDESFLDETLGAENYRLAHNQDEVTSSIGQARFGRELFPMLITLVAGLFLAEQAMSNRFYSFSFAPTRGK